MASRLVGYYAFLLLQPFPKVLSSADGIFTCPVFWMDKSAYNLTCEVDTASVNDTTCPGVSGELSFSFTPYGGVLLQYCTVSSYFDAGCDKSFNSKGCRCKEKTNNDTYVLEYMVTADVTTQMGGSWSCVPLCFDSNFFPVSKNITPVGNCTNVVIVTTTTTPITTVASVLSLADGIFTCPGFWMDKSAYNLTCEVYTASVNATTCPMGFGELSFGFTPYGGVLQQYCTVSSYFDAGCDKSFNSRGCRCKEKTNNDTYVLEYMVTADVTTQMGGSWSCVPLCFDSNLVPVSKTITPIGNCTNIVIVSTSKRVASEITPAATTLPPATEVTPACSHTDVTLTCPAVWNHNDPVTLTCEVSASSVGSAACPGVSGQISFHFTSRAGSQAPVCILPSYLDAACDGVFNAHGCRCKEKTANGTYILEYTVTADVTKHEGGSWTCGPVCLDFNYIPVAKTTLTVGSCTNVQFESSTATTTTKTITEKVATTVISMTTTRTVNGTTTITTETIITTANTTVTVLN